MGGRERGRAANGGRKGIECGWIIRVRASFPEFPSKEFKDEDLIFASVKTHAGRGINRRKLRKISLLLLSVRLRSKMGVRKNEKQQA